MLVCQKATPRVSMWSALGCPEEGRGSCLGFVRCQWVSPVAGAVLPEGRGCPGGGVCAPCSSLCLQEKMKGKNKLVPRLLGITKECVMRVDEKTKEVIQEWNLTNIKRWAASPKSFTLVTPPPPAQPGHAASRHLPQAFSPVAPPWPRSPTWPEPAPGEGGGGVSLAVPMQRVAGASATSAFGCRILGTTRTATTPCRRQKGNRLPSSSLATLTSS